MSRLNDELKVAVSKLAIYESLLQQVRLGGADRDGSQHVLTSSAMLFQQLGFNPDLIAAHPPPNTGAGRSMSQAHPAPPLTAFTQHAGIGV